MNWKNIKTNPPQETCVILLRRFDGNVRHLVLARYTPHNRMLVDQDKNIFKVDNLPGDGHTYINIDEIKD